MHGGPAGPHAARLVGRTCAAHRPGACAGSRECACALHEKLDDGSNSDLRDSARPTCDDRAPTSEAGRSRRMQMSEQNVELHRRTAAAFTSGDVEAFLACFHPNVEFHTEFAEMGGLYHGHDGLRRFLRDFEDAWGGEMRIEPEAYFDLGETTLLFLVARARGTRSGADRDVDGPRDQVVRWPRDLLQGLRGQRRCARRFGRLPRCARCDRPLRRGALARSRRLHREGSLVRAAVE